jgi:hypothetical protein
MINAAFSGHALAEWNGNILRKQTADRQNVAPVANRLAQYKRLAISQ